MTNDPERRLVDILDRCGSARLIVAEGREDTLTIHLPKMDAAVRAHLDRTE